MKDAFLPPNDVEESFDDPWFVNCMFPYIKLPKALFSDPYKTLSAGAKICYGLLLDRAGLSYKNNWKVDGSYYLYFTLESLRSMLNCSLGRCTRCYRELESAGLVRRKKQGQGKPARIEVLPIRGVLVTDKAVRNAQPRMQKMNSQESAKSTSNKSEFSDTDIS